MALLRTSHATWLKLAVATVKDAQTQMLHSRVTTTLEIYEQFVPESQRNAVEGMGRFDLGGQMPLAVGMGKVN